MNGIFDAYCTLGSERETQVSPEELLQRMDRAGIHRAVIAPEDREIAVHNAAGNDRILELSRRHDGRFLPACTVNAWYGQAGCEELRRAVRNGAVMLIVAPALQGFSMCDGVADDLLLTAADLRVPVYVHTGPHSFGAPAQLALTATAHPRTRFILGHCGSADYVYDMPGVIAAGLENLWFETSLVRPWAAAAYAKLLRWPAIVFGSSAPRNDPAYELERLRRELPLEAYPEIYGETLAQLLQERV